MYYIKYVLWRIYSIYAISKLAVASLNLKNLCLRECEAVSKKKDI